MRTKLNIAQTSADAATDNEVVDAIISHKADTDAHNVYCKPADVVTFVNGRKGSVALTKDDVGLNNVNNVADYDKPVSAAMQNGLNAKVNSSLLAVADGVATLDSTGKVPSNQLPSYVDDVLEYADVPAFPPVGEAGKIYIAIDTGNTYRWSGTIYAAIISGAVVSVAGKTGVVALVKGDVGLANVDNTSDANKPISSVQQTAITAAENNARAASAPIAHVGAGSSAHSLATTGSHGFMSITDKIKLDAITGSNSGDETVTTIKTKLGISTLSGANTGDQTTITGNAGTATKLQTSRLINGVAFDGSVDIVINAVDSTARVATSQLGVANGVATLDSTGKVPSNQLPSFVDDVSEHANLAAFPGTGETGKIYVALDTNKTYRWGGSVYVYITSGAVDSVAGKTGVVVLNKSDVGLNNVDNTSDVNKPVSSVQQTALDAKIPWTSSGAPGGVASLDSSSKLLFSQLPLIKLIGLVSATSGSSIIPLDNTTPLVTEGTEINSQTFGPSSNSSKLLITGTLQVDCGNSNRNLIVACFKDNVCLGSIAMNFVSSARPQIFHFDFYDPDFGSVFGSTAKYSIRFGVATSATWYVNRLATAALNGNMALNRPVQYEEIN